MAGSTPFFMYSCCRELEFPHHRKHRQQCVTDQFEPIVSKKDGLAIVLVLLVGALFGTRAQA